METPYIFLSEPPWMWFANEIHLVVSAKSTKYHIILLVCAFSIVYCINMNPLLLLLLLYADDLSLCRRRISLKFIICLTTFEICTEFMAKTNIIQIMSLRYTNWKRMNHNNVIHLWVFVYVVCMRFIFKIIKRAFSVLHYIISDITKTKILLLT